MENIKDQMNGTQVLKATQKWEILKSVSQGWNSRGDT